ncbi:glycosyltransferase family protein [Vibrio proteolyticus]|nr:glycosyltransferase [Vibrio proteolyticus]
MINVICYFPFPLSKDKSRGSAIRPLRMVEAFKSIGCHVTVIDGYSKDRSKKIAQLDVKDIHFVYAESSTMPLALTDPDHFPRKPCLEYNFFNKLSSKGVPVYYFYRDIYWRFPEYKQNLSFFKWFPAKVFYWLELIQMSKVVSKLYLPSQEMSRYLPVEFEHISSLPPGSIEKDLDLKKHKGNGILKLLYVGGVSKPHYDISPLIKLALKFESKLDITICCRSEEWKSFNISSIPKNITIVHSSGDELDELYLSTDLFANIRITSEYLSFAMPIKVFESLGYGVPQITQSGTAQANFVESENIGITYSNEEELFSLVNGILEDKSKLSKLKENCLVARKKHYWNSRANTIINEYESQNGKY